MPLGKYWPARGKVTGKRMYSGSFFDLQGIFILQLKYD